MQTIGDITTVPNFSEDIYPENYEVETVKGLLIVATEAELRAAPNLLYCTVDIYPHPVNQLIKGECTPENYAHALARLEHAESSSPTADHLAREVRSSQALQESVAALQAERERLNDLVHGDTTKRNAAWMEYLNLRKQIRRLAAEGRTDTVEQAELVARAINIASVHHFDAPSPTFDDIIAERDRTIVNMQGTIDELVRQASALRQQGSDAAMEAQGRVAELEAERKAILVAHEAMRGLMDGYRGDARDVREEVTRLRRVLHKHDISADASGEEFDG